jgi:hypothetical protein
LALSPSLRARLDVAIARLNLGRRRFTPGDQAIEAGICLEVLLGDKDDRQDLSYKLRLRTALLLEQALEPRRAVLKAVKLLYNLRSKTVHGATGSNLADDQKIARAGLDVCARVLRETVLHGTMIDGAELELKGKI